MEPMTIFGRIVDVAGVARLLRQSHPGAILDGPDDNWRSATVSFGSRKLTFSHNPEYYAEPNWSRVHSQKGVVSKDDNDTIG